MAASQPASPKRAAQAGEGMREQILAAAEQEFAARGFAPARLEDIAERIGITRAAVIYHFRDKQTLYEAVLESAFTPLLQRIRHALESDDSHAARIEAMVDAWIRYAGERPTLARLFMREVADSAGELRPGVRRLVDPMYAMVLQGIEQGQKEGAVRKVTPAHLVSILAGATVWFVTGDPLLQRRNRGKPPSSARLEAFREDVLGVTRFLLRGKRS